MKRLFVLGLAVLFSTRTGLAQANGSSVRVGDRVRLLVVDTVNASAGDIRYSNPTGTISAFGDGTLLLAPDSTGRHAGEPGSVRVSATNVSFAEKLVGHRRHFLEGAAAGLVLGAAAGYIGGNGGGEGGQSCSTIGGVQFCNDSPGRADQRTRSAAKWGGAGAVAGALVGYFVRTERWSRLDVGALRLQLSVR